MSDPAGLGGRPWWEDSVIYQIYPRSFSDSDGDGVGDLRGIVERLDYLQWLGVDAVWLSPVTVSPNADWGYDVADYCDVQPEYGTASDLDDLIAGAAARGIRVVMDLVPNHTSDRHRWFEDSRSSPTSRHRDWYVWSDARPDGSPPNNWVSSFGGPAWTLDEATGQYYLHNFLPEQPDLNWWNDEVRQAFDEILRHWFDRGVSGFRIDVCHMIVKDRQLRDNPPATPDDHWLAQMYGQRTEFNSNQPEVHEVLRRWRRIAEAYGPARLLLGETNVEELPTVASYYGNGHDELHLAFNFPFIEAPFEAGPLRTIVEEMERLLPPGAWPVWTGSNHDVPRFPTRWAAGDLVKARAAMLMLLTLRGTPVLYQGDEIGMTDTPLDRDDLLDPVGERFWPAYAGRDPVRTPMVWQDEPGAGFTTSGVRPWLPMGSRERNVESQRADEGSLLNFTRELMSLRRSTTDLRYGSYSSLAAPDAVWAWRRGESIVVALNLSDETKILEDVSGGVAMTTIGRRQGEPVRGSLRLDPWEGAVVRAGG